MPNQSKEIHDEFEALVRAHCNLCFLERDTWGAYMSSFTRDQFALFKATRLFYLSRCRMGEVKFGPDTHIPTKEAIDDTAKSAD